MSSSDLLALRVPKVKSLQHSYLISNLGEATCLCSLNCLIQSNLDELMEIFCNNLGTTSLGASFYK